MARTRTEPPPVEEEELEQPEPLEPDLVNDGRTIHQRMIAILGELPAIGKSQYNEQQKFHFRGHDDVLNALTPLLAKHGVFIVPDVVERVTSQRSTRNNSIMYEVNLHIVFTCWGAAGDSMQGSAWGEGTDMGDKATMKAGTMAFKAFLNQSFAISTEEGAKHDADKTTMEETVREVEQQKPKPPQGWAQAIARFDALVGSKGDAAGWLAELVEVQYEVSTMNDLTSAQKSEALRSFGSALMLLEERYDDLALAPGLRQIIAGAFAETNNGLMLEGPVWPLDEAEAAKQAAEEAQQGLSGLPPATQEPGGGDESPEPQSGSPEDESRDSEPPDAFPVSG